MPTLYTTCARDCYDACRMKVETNNDGQIVSIKGDVQHPITKGFLCPRGNKEIEHLYKNRVDTNYIRQNQKFEKATFNETIDFVASKTQEIIDIYGAKSIVYVDFAGNEGLVQNVFARRLWNFLGVSFTDQALCTASGHFGIGLHYGETYGLMPNQIAEKKLIVFWGFNSAVSAMHIWKIATDARKSNKTKILVIDPIATTTAQNADFYYQINPGTDVLLAYSVMKIIVEKNKHDLSFIEQYTSGFEQLKEKLKEISLEYVSKVTGIEIRQIEELAEMIIDANKESVVMTGVSLQKRHLGYEQVRCITLIPALMGIHRGFFYSNSQGFNIDTEFIEGKHLNKSRSKIQIVALAKEIDKGKVKMLIVNSMNPAASLPNTKEFLKSIEKNKPFVVVNETHWSETAQIADAVLAVPTFLEKEDVMLSWFHNYVGTSFCCTQRQTDSHTEVEIMQSLAKRLNINNQEIFADYHNVITKAFEKALDEPQKLFNSAETMQIKTKPQNVYQTQSHKIEFYSSKALNLGLNPLPEYIEQLKQNDEFVLITPALPKYTNSQFTEVYGAPEKYVIINSNDAKKLNLSEKDKVMVYNNLANLIFEVKITNDVKQGVVCIGRFAKDFNDKSVNCLISNDVQAFSNGPVFHSTLVKIAKAL